MTRRSLLMTAAGTALGTALLEAAPQESHLSVEGYIFQQYASRVKKPLGDLLDEVIPMARRAGFRNIELNDAFFAPEIRERTLSLIRAEGLSMPSVYVGGALHDKDLARQTIERVLSTCDICAPFGCHAVVNNPDPKPGGAFKTDADLAVEAESINALNRALADRAFELRIHHHTPQLENHAREWRFLLRHTDAHLCVDVDWAYEGGFDPIAFLNEAGTRVAELHVRSARNKVWLEDVEDSDIDYTQVAAYLKGKRMHPLIVVELAYRTETKVTRSLEEDLALSRKYTARVFRIP